MNIGGGWHTDHSYDAVPAMGSILVARELPPSGGDTLFAHMGAAYDLLAPEVKQQIEGLRAWHSADHVYSLEGVYAQTDMASELRGQDLKTGAEHRWSFATRRRGANCSTSIPVSPPISSA